MTLRKRSSTRSQIRDYMMKQDFGKKVTIEKIAGALDIDHKDIVHNMGTMIRLGEPFEVVTKAKAWIYLPPGVKMDVDPDGKPLKQKPDPDGTTKYVRDERGIAVGVSHVGAQKSGMDLSSSQPFLDNMKTNVPNPYLPSFEAKLITNEGAVVLQDSNGEVWIARKSVSL